MVKPGVIMYHMKRPKRWIFGAELKQNKFVVMSDVATPCEEKENNRAPGEE